MKFLLIIPILLLSFGSFAQDTLWVGSGNYDELTQRVTLRYYRNGVVGEKIITRNGVIRWTYKWDESGKLIRKSKTTRTLFRRTPVARIYSIEYYDNGEVKQKNFAKMVGCDHFKRAWKKYYSEDGKHKSTERM